MLSSKVLALLPTHELVSWSYSLGHSALGIPSCCLAGPERAVTRLRAR